MTDDVITALRGIADRTVPPSAFDLDGAVRRGRRRVRRRRVARYGAGVLAATVVAVLAWPGGSDSTIGPADGPSAMAEHLALFATPQQPADEPPAEAFRGVRMDEPTIRGIPATLSSVRHWVGLDMRGNICLAFVRAFAYEPDWLVASGCAEPDVFAEEGLWFASSAGTGGLHAVWLLPDGHEFDPSGPDSAPPGPEWTLVADNLAIR